MSRIDRFLDGDLSRSALTGPEQTTANQAEAVIDAVRAALDAQPPPDLTGQVMSQVAASPAPLVTRSRVRPVDLVQTLWNPRRISFQLRPAWGLFVSVLALLAAVQWGGRAAAPTEVSDPPAQALLVQFRLDTEASSVRLAGSFTNWEPRFELREIAPGVWSALLPVPLGVHDYAFLVDGTEWRPDPYAPQVSDGFGGRNSRLALMLTGGPKT